MTSFTNYWLMKAAAALHEAKEAAPKETGDASAILTHIETAEKRTAAAIGEISPRTPVCFGNHQNTEVLA